MRYKALITIGIVALAGTALVAAQPAQKKRSGPADRMARLDLTEEQKVKLDTLRSEFQKAQIRSRADLKVARLELRELISSDTIDEKAVFAKVSQVSELQNAAFKARVEHQLAVAKVLTPEQRAKMKAFKLRRHARRGHMGRRGPGARMLQPAPGPDPVGETGGEIEENVGSHVGDDLI